jgi:hypothetical protein
MSESLGYSNPMRSGETKLDSSFTGASKSIHSTRRSVIMENFDSLPEISNKLQQNSFDTGKEVFIGGESVMLYNDAYFAKIRNRFNIPLDLVTTKEIFDWDKLQPSEGKGGDAMSFLLNRTYIIKELGSDHPTLLKITKEYVQHVCGDSFMVRFGLHFKRKSNNKNYVLMNSWLPGSEKELKDKTNFPEDVYEEIYDLKGCADDKMMAEDGKTMKQVHKRFHYCAMHCCEVSTERQRYKKGKIKARNNKFYLFFNERKHIMAKIQSDAQFLRINGLMDYSLIVGIKTCPIEVFQDKYLPKGGFSSGVNNNESTQPYYVVHNRQVLAYYIGIIDFLQFYNCKKKIAHYIKCCDVKPLATVKPSAYGIRFDDYFSKKFILSKDSTPSWLKKENGCGIVSSSGNGNSSGSGGGSGSSYGNGSTKNGNDEKPTNLNYVETPAPAEDTPVKNMVTGAAMVIAAAGVAAIEMGVLGSPKEDEATR